eukprot:gene3914-5175_t
MAPTRHRAARVTPSRIAGRRRSKPNSPARSASSPKALAAAPQCTMTVTPPPT